MRQKKTREGRDIPLLAIKNSNKRKFLKNEGFPHKALRYCERINFRQSRDTPSYAIFLIQNFSGKRVPLRIFSVLWDKKVSRESRDIPLLSRNLFDKGKFLKKKGSPTKISVLWENQFSTKSWYTILCNFFNPEFFWNKTVLLAIFFGIVRQKNFRRESWYPFPIHKIFRENNFFEKRRVPRRKFSVLWENQFSTKSWYTILCNFFNPELFSIKRVTLGIFLGLSDKIGSRESPDIPLLAIKISDKRKFLKIEGFSYKILRYCERINFRQSRDTPLMQFS